MELHSATAAWHLALRALHKADLGAVGPMRTLDEPPNANYHNVPEPQDGVEASLALLARQMKLANGQDTASDCFHARKISASPVLWKRLASICLLKARILKIAFSTTLGIARKVASGLELA